MISSEAHLELRLHGGGEEGLEPFYNTSIRRLVICIHKNGESAFSPSDEKQQTLIYTYPPILYPVVVFLIIFSTGGKQGRARALALALRYSCAHCPYVYQERQQNHSKRLHNNNNNKLSPTNLFNNY